MGWFGSRRRPRGAVRDGATEAATGDGKGTAGPAAVREGREAVEDVLRQCCEYGIPALAVSPDLMVGLPGRFETVAADTVVLRVVAGDRLSWPFEPLGPCFVSYSKHSKGGMFATTVRYARWRGRYHHLVLELPERVLIAEARQSFRVPVDEEVGMGMAAVLDDDRRVTGRCVNIAASGALIEVDERARVALCEAAGFQLELSIGERLCAVRAEVQRVHEGRLGLFFPDCLVDGRVSAPDELLDVVRATERVWLKKKAAQRR